MAALVQHLSETRTLKKKNFQHVCTVSDDLQQSTGQSLNGCQVLLKHCINGPKKIQSRVYVAAEYHV